MKVIDFITSLRETDEYIEHIFLNGSCYRFHLLLKKLYPESIPYLSKKEDHVITKIKGRFYDITGIVNSDGYSELKDLKKVESWSFHNNNYLKITECPYCEEPITA